MYIYIYVFFGSERIFKKKKEKKEQLPRQYSEQRGTVPRLKERGMVHHNFLIIRKKKKKNLFLLLSFFFFFFAKQDAAVEVLSGTTTSGTHRLLGRAHRESDFNFKHVPS